MFFTTTKSAAAADFYTLLNQKRVVKNIQRKDDRMNSLYTVKFFLSYMKSSKISTTPIMAMGCRQCLPFSVVQLKSKRCQKLHCRNGVVDTFGQGVNLASASTSFFSFF